MPNSQTLNGKQTVDQEPVDQEVVQDGAADQPETPAKPNPDEIQSVKDLQPPAEPADKVEENGDVQEPEEGEDGNRRLLEKHPRFREVYKSMKRLEREKDELAKDIDAMRAFNRELATRLETVQNTKADRAPEEIPDFREDPEAAKTWIQKEMETRQKQLEKQLATDRHQMQLEMMMEAHPDYDDMINFARRDLERDPELVKKIYASGNAPKAAYEYAKKKKAEVDKVENEELARLSRIKSTRVNGAGETVPPDNSEEQLNEDELRVVRRMFDDLPLHEAKKKYLAQKKAIGGRR